MSDGFSFDVPDFPTNKPKKLTYWFKLDGYSLFLHEGTIQNFSATSVIGIAALGSAIAKQASEIPTQVAAATNASESLDGSLTNLSDCTAKWHEYFLRVQALIAEQFDEFASGYLKAAPDQDTDRVRKILEEMRLDLMDVVDSRIRFTLLPN